MNTTRTTTYICKLTISPLVKCMSALVFCTALAACGGGGGGGSGGNNSGNTSSSSSSSSSSSGDSGSSTSSSSSSGSTGPIEISGNVSGLSAGVVKISNAGTSPTEINEDGSFVFSVPDGGSFDILVESNPIEHLCHVENGTGSNVSSGVENISIVCEPVATATSCEGFADSDADGVTDCEELQTYATHPWLADTDGDGFDDGREVLDFDAQSAPYVFNPRVADMAKIAVDLTAVPEIDLDFTESSGGSRTVATAYEQSESENISRDWGGEISRQLEVGHTLSVETTQTVGTEVNVSLTDIGASSSYESSLSVGFESSVSQTRGSSVNWSNSASQENSRAYSETLELSEEQSSTYNGGYLRVTAQVRNSGHIPYDLENLTLSAVLFDPLRPFDVQSIGTMEFSSGGFPPTTILPGNSAPLNFSTQLTLGKAQQLLRDSDNIVVMPGTYRLLDSEDRSILLVDRDVSARTATINVDYGIHQAREDKFRVAVNRGAGQRYITVLHALQNVLGISVSEGEGSWIFGNDSSASSTPTGLLALGTTVMDVDSNSYWLLAHNRNSTDSSNQRVTDYYNLLQSAYSLSDIQLRAGDKLTLVYVSDSDRDGLSDRQERELGTNQSLLDTDGDGLGDALEYYGWLTNYGTAPCDIGTELTRVYSNPLVRDSDEDGIEDAAEKAACENPSFDFVAEAGIDQVVNKNTLVTLYGSIDGLAHGNAVYQWDLIHGPDVKNSDGESSRSLSGRQPQFTAPDEVSTLVWELSITVAGKTQKDTSKVQVQLDRNLAVYVGAKPEGAIANGSMEAPFTTISEALSSMMPGEHLYVMTKAEPYNLVNTLNVPDGTSMFGGYDSNWIRDVEHQLTPLHFNTVLEQPAVRFAEVTEHMWFSGFSIYANGSGGNAGYNVIAVDVNAGTDSATLNLVSNFIESSNVAAGTSAHPGSSYAVRVNGLSALRMLNNHLRAGRGGFGSHGVAGSVGANGGNASARSGGSGGSGGNGGNGGVGGAGGVIVDRTGGNGGTGGHISSSVRGGAGGSGASACNYSNDVADRGDNGTDGIAGTAAGQPNYIDYVSEYGFFKAGDGNNGGHGAGGGGGGAGGGCGTASGARGGGGGEGGTGGTRGTGGFSGGASIGLWLNNVANVELRSNLIEGGTGGSAGNGGSGMRGGYGGSYASAGSPDENCVLGICDRGATGARGGNGGNGGRGGDGGGGVGGASFGVFVTPGVAPLFFDNKIYAGIGGNGGYSRTNGGRGGDSYAIYDADLNDGAIPELVSGNTLVLGVAGSGGSTSVGTAGASGLLELSNF